MNGTDGLLSTMDTRGLLVVTEEERQRRVPDTVEARVKEGAKDEMNAIADTLEEKWKGVGMFEEGRWKERGVGEKEVKEG